MTLDDLVAYGANVDEGLARCMNMEDFYLRLVSSLQTETGYDTLKSALDQGDLDEAFRTAHSLKGTLANLAITPLLEPVEEITELLRARTPMDYTPLMNKILEERDRFRAL